MTSKYDSIIYTLYSNNMENWSIKFTGREFIHEAFTWLLKLTEKKE